MPKTLSKNGDKEWVKAVRVLSKRLDRGEHVPLSRGQDLVKQKKLMEEESRFYRRAKDIWFRLSAQDRKKIRMEVMKETPFYDDPYDSIVEGICINRIKEKLRGKISVGSRK